MCGCGKGQPILLDRMGRHLRQSVQSGQGHAQAEALEAVAAQGGELFQLPNVFDTFCGDAEFQFAEAAYSLYQFTVRLWAGEQRQEAAVEFHAFDWQVLQQPFGQVFRFDVIQYQVDSECGGFTQPEAVSLALGQCVFRYFNHQAAPECVREACEVCKRLMPADLCGAQVDTQPADVFVVDKRSCSGINRVSREGIERVVVAAKQSIEEMDGRQDYALRVQPAYECLMYDRLAIGTEYRLVVVEQILNFRATSGRLVPANASLLGGSFLIFIATWGSPMHLRYLSVLW